MYETSDLPESEQNIPAEQVNYTQPLCIPAEQVNYTQPLCIPAEQVNYTQPLCIPAKQVNYTQPQCKKTSLVRVCLKLGCTVKVKG